MFFKCFLHVVLVFFHVVICFLYVFYIFFYALYRCPSALGACLAEPAAAAIKADEKRYLSPTWSMSHANRRTGAKGGPWLYGAALLNDPFYDSMPRVAASDTAARR